MPISFPTEHARHDTTLIARHAAGDLPDTDRTAADALIAACAPCAELRRDLVAIAAATRSLPAPMTARRDFRLEPAQADRLRRGSWLRNLLRPFGATRSGVRPMAAALTSLGVAGLFVALVLPGATMTPAAPGAAERQGLQVAATNAPVPASTDAAFGGFHPTSQGSPDSGYLGANGGTTSQGSGANATDDKRNDLASEEAPEVPPQAAVGGGATPGADVDNEPSDRTVIVQATNPLLLASLAFLALGLLLFTLLFAARRVR